MPGFFGKLPRTCFAGQCVCQVPYAVRPIPLKLVPPFCKDMLSTPDQVDAESHNAHLFQMSLLAVLSLTTCIRHMLSI